MNQEYRLQPRLEWHERGTDDSDVDQFEAIWWLDEHGVFNFDFPMRSFLRDIAEAVKGDLVLPTYFEYEDFVEGELMFDSNHVKIYFEHSLMYILFRATAQVVIGQLIVSANALSICSHSGYGVEPIS